MDLETCTLEKDGQVATVTIIPPRLLVGGTADLHWELGEVFSALRGDNDIRVVVLTGRPGEPGESGDFYAPMQPEFYDDPKLREYVAKPDHAWKTFTGILRTHQGMCELEKPIVGKITGDAVGFGSSLAFACDLIVTREDAQFIDIHLGMGEIHSGPGFGIVTGDGGSSVVPLHMPMAMAKEYLMLAKPYSGAELAARGIVNYAVPAPDLDAKTDEIVQALLRRSAYALAWTKRTINRRVADQLNMTLDASAAYEMVNFLQIGVLDGKDPKHL
jgi:enoyl-CoA hydratase